MKTPSLAITLTLLLFLHPSGSFAQSAMDPSTATLLKGASAPEPEHLDSSRFTVTPPVHEADSKPEPTLVVKKKKKTAPPKIVAQPTPAAVLAPASETPPVVVHPSLSEQVKVLFLGNPDDIEDFRKQIHPSDRRNNIFELAIAPTYVYDSSSSNYSFRNFTVQSPGLDVNAKLWVTPFFGVQATYLSTLGAMVMSPQAQQMVPLNFQNIEFGVRFRKHFGLQRKSSSVTWGLDFVQTIEGVPASATDRVSTSTSGLSLSLQGDLPMSLSYSTFVGVELQPRLVHSEISDLNIHSGGRNDTNAIGAWIGGDLIFDRKHQMFWKLHERVERNVFDGSATTLDPVTNVKPDGTSVTNATTMFSIGYRWGN